MAQKYSEAVIQQVLDHISSSSAPLAARAISVQLNLHKQTVGDILRELYARDLVTRELGSRGASGGRPPYLYRAVHDNVSAPVEADAPAESATTTLKFRGKSAVRTAYITLTGATYGQGSRFTAGALTRHVAMKKYSPEAVYQALNKLEADGMIEHVSQLKGKPGRSNKRYRVLVGRDENLVPKRVVSRGPKIKSAPVVATTKQAAAVTGLTPDTIEAMLVERDEVKARLADNRQRVAADELRLAEIDNTFDAIRKRLG